MVSERLTGLARNTQVEGVDGARSGYALVPTGPVSRFTKPPHRPRHVEEVALDDFQGEALGEAVLKFDSR